jgi:hypothetical protein
VLLLSGVNWVAFTATDDFRFTPVNGHHKSPSAFPKVPNPEVADTKKKPPMAASRTQTSWS